MIEALFELLVQFVLEVLGQLIFELLTSLGWESVKDTFRPRRHASPILSAIGQFLLGGIAGGISLLILPERVATRSFLPGVSLLLSPIGTGIVMHSIGEMWPDDWREKPALFSFWSGAIFALGMALVRLTYFEWR